MPTIAKSSKVEAAFPWMSTLASRIDVQAGVLAAAGALVWLLAAPRTPDLAAQSYRVGLFAREGFAIWDNGWYAGHHLPAYSLLFPALASQIGMRVVGALAAVLAAVCFARLAEVHFGSRARTGILWFSLATVTDLAIGRLTYGLGTALALAALYAAQRRASVVAVILAALTAAATPLAGIFLGMVATALFICGRRRTAVTLAVPALGVAAAMAFVFPEGGRQPFGTLALLGSVILTLAFLLLTEQRLLRIGGGLYLLGTLVSFVVVSPVGGNTTRLGAVLAGPLLLCARAQRSGDGGSGRADRAARAAPLVLVALFCWQWYAPVREMGKGVGDPLTRRSTYTGLFAFLAAHRTTAGRVEVPFTRSHWEAAYVSSRAPLARGWETQLDAGYNRLFFHHRLLPATYHAWLRSLGVRYVAVAMAPSDPSSRSEVHLVLGGVSYLHPVYRDPHWRVFALVDPQPLASPPARLTYIGLQSFTLRFSRPGSSLARVRYSPYWQASTGCVARGPGGFTQVSSATPAVVRVAIAFSLARTVASARRCTAPRPGFSAQAAGYR